MNSCIRPGKAAPLFTWREHCLCSCLIRSDRAIIVAMRQGSALRRLMYRHELLSFGGGSLDVLFIDRQERIVREKYFRCLGRISIILPAPQLQVDWPSFLRQTIISPLVRIPTLSFVTTRLPTTYTSPLLSPFCFHFTQCDGINEG